MATLDQKLLSNPLREKILDLIREEPSTRSQLVAHTGASYGHVAYHARVLCRAGEIFRVEDAGSDPADPLYEICC